MMKNFTLLIVMLLVSVVFNPFQAKASHALGADITYTCVGPNTYDVVVSFYRDCDGISAPTSIFLEYEAPGCGIGASSLTLTSGAGCTNAVGQCCGQELPGVCGAQSNNTTCNNGTYPGVEITAYCGTLVLPSACEEWIIGYAECCRNSAITNLVNGSSNDQYVYTTINNMPNVAGAGCNSSPIFTNNPSELFCSGYNYCYNHGVVDFDGDSLVFSLIAPLDDYGVPITYEPGLSPALPMEVVPGTFSFDSQTGQICFEANTPQAAVITLLVEEYRTINGVAVLVGSTTRDIQFQVLASNLCSGTQPENPTLGNVTGVNASDSVSVELCQGNAITFDVGSFDASGNIITMTTNVASAIPGANFTITPAVADTFVNGAFSWQPGLGDAGLYFFTVTVTNDACPIPLSSQRTIQVFVYDRVTIASSSQAFCGDSVQLSAVGGSNFVWTPTVGMSNPNSAVTMVAPLVPTWYKVVTECGEDSVFVDVTPDYQVTAGNDTSICLNSLAQLNAQVTGPGSQGIYAPMTYTWSPAGPNSGLDSANRNQASPPVSPDVDTEYILTTENAQGCLQRDTVNVAISGVAPNVLALTTPDTVCPGGTVQLEVSSAPLNCGPSTRACITNTVDYQVGNGAATNTTSGYPSIYGHFYRSGKTQVLYLASELQAMGLSGGTITELSWDIAAIDPAAFTQYCSFTIKMGCTSTSSMTGFETGLTQVLNPTTIGITTGWNTHVFDVPYDWDGVSNIVIDICYNNIPCDNGSWTDNAETRYTPTSFGSYVYVRSDGTDQCPSSSTGNVLQDRPNLRFGICQQGLAPGALVNWTPVGNITTNPNSVNPLGRVFGNTTFIVNVDEGNGCIGQSAVNVFVDSSLLVVGGPDTSLCVQTPITLNATAIGTPSPIPLNCGVNGTPCGTGSNTYTMGTAAGITNRFTPYTDEESGKIQMLFTANELGANGLGMKAGIFTALALNVNAKNSSAPYNNFTISMSCTDSTSLNDFTTAPLTVVYGPVSATTAAGLNTYTLTGAYEWDGFSNIIVEITYDNGFGTSNGGDLTVVSTTTATTVVQEGFFFGASNGVGAGNDRPDITFTQCPPPPGTFEYFWSPPTDLTHPVTGVPTDTGQTIVATPGATIDYRVEVSDGTCTAFDTVTIEFYNDYLGNISGRNVGCFGANSGDLVSNPSGGNPPYDFVWYDASTTVPTQIASTLAAVSDTVVGVAAGTYYLELTDANGCLAFDTVTLTVPPPLVVDSTVAVDVSCFGENDGVAQAFVSGGTPPYSYLWTTGDTGSVFANRVAGTYYFTAMDSTGCTISDSVIVAEPGEITYTLDSTITSCFQGTDGTATITITGGGSGDFSYQWDAAAASQTTATATGLAAGSYAVTVTDTVGGCLVDDVVIVTEPDSFIITTTVLQDASCFNSNDGSASADVGGVIAGYTFEWDNSETTAIATQLSGGLHSVTVTNTALGCEQSTTVTIGSPPRFFLASTTTETTCFGGDDGTATVTITSGGTPPFTYSWTNGDLTATATGLKQDSTYIVTVTDASAAGCVEYDTVTISGPTQLVLVNGGVEPVVCSGESTGSAQVNVSGGTTPYTYAWTGGATTDLATDLPAGSYNVTVTDANGCIDSLNNLVVQEPLNPLNVTYTINKPCEGDTDGAIFLTADGGTEPYYFSIDGGVNFQENNGNFVALPVNSYPVVVVDSSDCPFEEVVDVVAHPPFTVSFIPPYDTIILGQTTVLQPIVEPFDSSNYSYNWQPANTLNCDTCETPTSNTVTNTVYEVTVYDENDCPQDAEITVYVINDKIVYVPNVFTPNGDGLNDTWFVSAPGGERLNAKLYNRWGELVFASEGDLTAKWDGKYKGKTLPPDVYVYYIEVIYLDGQRTAQKGSVTILK